MRAMILAAGRGSRMQHLTEHTPKPLLAVHGKPLIVHLIEQLVACHISHIVINTYYHADKLMQYLGDGSRWQAQLSYSDESHCSSALDTAGGIAHALPLLGADPFLVISGDIYTHYDFSQLSLPADSLGHVVCVPNPDYHREGDFAFDHTSTPPRVNMTASPRYTYGNIAILHPSLLAPYPANPRGLGSVFQHACQQQQLTGELFHGFWDNVGTVAQWQHYQTTT